MCCIAKVYSSILNSRLQKYLNDNDILVDEQNGFRASRSCIDHIFTLVTILRNRKSLGKPSFVSFIDFKKAFDSVDRNLLLYKLSKIGVVGNIYNAISALYKDPKSRVILNDISTDWFTCPIGVKQGDTLSPTLFAIFINDLAEEIKESGIGIDIDDDLIVNVLLYADDIVLLAKSEDDLQSLLNIVNSWCSKWRLEVNLLKTNIMHVRKKQARRVNFDFQFENGSVEYCDKYKYLGVTLNEHLDFEKTTFELCESAGRALGGLITKMIKNGGFPLNVYTKLYESCICSISDYGSEVFGFHEYNSIEKIQSRAIRAFIGVNKTTPIPGMKAEINWMEARSRTQIRMVRMYHRLVNLPETRLTKKIFRWDARVSELNFATWSSEIEDILSRNELRATFSANIFDLTSTLKTLENSLFRKDQIKFQTQCLNMPKLRTYNSIAKFKANNCYLTKPLSFIQRKFLAKLRLGVLGLRIETGRYERPKKAPEDRTCNQCTMGVPEDETHFLLFCTKHSLQRNNLFSNIVNENFQNLNSIEKLKFLLNNPSIVKQTAQFIVNAYNNRVID